MSGLLSIYAAARFLSIDSRELRGLIEAGDVPRVELPTGDVRFDAGDLIAWTETMKKRPARLVETVES